MPQLRLNTAWEPRWLTAHSPSRPTAVPWAERARPQTPSSSASPDRGASRRVRCLRERPTRVPSSTTGSSAVANEEALGT